MKTWLEPSQLDVPQALKDAVGGHPLVGETLARRGIQDPQAARSFLDPDYYTPAPPSELPGMSAAVERLERAIAGGESLWVWGDFDVDGQTSTTLLVSALGELGANVNYHIPVRASESHGVNIPVLGQILDQGAQLVLTCDTGIAAHEAVAYAQGRGVELIVTDHHDLPPTLPEAYAIVNPKMLPEGHPLSTLPGVGVAYKLVEALFLRAGREAELDQYLDLVALGIVADIALQTGDTRYLLQRGLEVLREAQRLGLKVLMEMAELNPAWLTEEHIGFVLGPRLNALGRLGDANTIVEFLTTDDLGRARILALELEGLNARRKLLTDQVFQGAQAQLERDPALLQQAALVLAHPSWPAGVIGIVASRLVERYNKPTILISAPSGEAARGSARSVEGVNITAAIADQKDMLHGFGGHPMAAGLSVDPGRIPEFRRALSRTIGKMLGEVPIEVQLQVDGYLGL
ncbi:MAG: single-stranded-DNA-specific exonuclease RecJ, partial [Anaerolineales bacterium]|nr:single-stranded-DNA-specific exonuclease RecJ [Anaerolineales bacterium]